MKRPKVFTRGGKCARRAAAPAVAIPLVADFALFINGRPVDIQDVVPRDAALEALAQRDRKNAKSDVFLERFEKLAVPLSSTGYAAHGEQFFPPTTLGELFAWDKQGRLLTHNASTHQIPAISRAPVRMPIPMLPKAARPGTIHGRKAVGEPQLMPAFSVREAIRDAIASFGAPGGEVPLPSPSTCEAVLKAGRC